MKAVIAGIILGAAALAIAPHVPSIKPSVIPVPMCPPDQPGCTLQ